MTLPFYYGVSPVETISVDEINVHDLGEFPAISRGVARALAP